MDPYICTLEFCHTLYVTILETYYFCLPAGGHRLRHKRGADLRVVLRVQQGSEHLVDEQGDLLLASIKPIWRDERGSRLVTMLPPGNDTY